jgi:hypothetical protein
MSSSDDARRRIVQRIGVPDVVDTLAGLPGADFTSLMLHVMRARAARVTPADLKHQFDRDRFVAPAAVPLRDLRAAEDVLLASLPQEFDVIALSPLAPFGVHSAIATVDQAKVVSTVRGNEVAGDPTNVLVLEATRRRDGDGVVRLATTQRVVRAQTFAGPASWAHFQIFGLVTAGRDRGHRFFERAHLGEHIAFQVAALRAAGADDVRVELTDFTGEWTTVVTELQERFDAVVNPDRAGGAGYYEGLCFKVNPTFGDVTIETGDGGVVNWTQRLLDNRKERCVISGLGVDRIALAMAPPTTDRGR